VAAIIALHERKFLPRRFVFVIIAARNAAITIATANAAGYFFAIQFFQNIFIRVNRHISLYTKPGKAEQMNLSDPLRFFGN